jgi:predicted esterase
MLASNPQIREPGSPVFVAEPTTEHTHTIILLHGLGSNGEKLGKEFLDTGVDSSGRKLTELFPNVRFVFPTAKRRRASAGVQAPLVGL